ncbi:hypothetical protein E4T42_07437 [Aureobasidium subglaciale]|nr:hypothetical protein E4T38_05853 [Aureobasidium subglaciale]KAI5220867.1 hypothetical protein E4T40_05784 [Aureobasidium subglaciale]KAI5224687.1 hypothetical protein E4T41_05558 [Aureobasidium subglaciale]KAI5243119.1 hypothetical protein E4T42_07437 [Aureobasidium subglaciale]KAI5260925.1 hypothetical protein E4T46_05607 [Aureobasidium subglaciale]
MTASDLESDTIKAGQRDFIEQLFKTRISGVKIQGINTLPRCNNNYIHIITFEAPLISDVNVSTDPGTCAISSGLTKAVFRIGNLKGMFNHAVKVENTVATMQLVRQALSKQHLDIVPRVYAWSKTGGPSGNGWIMEEFKLGANIEPEFHGSLSADFQRVVLRQVAKVLKAVQDFELPSAAARFGGLAFDRANDGSVVSGPFVIEPYTDSFSNMKSFYQGMLQAQLADTDKTVAKGWREDGLRERLDAFAEGGLDAILSQTLAVDTRPNLIIGDIVIANFLFDPDTYQVLGLVDYDCSHTGHPLHEFFFSSFSLSYYALTPDPEVASALFHGFPTPLPPSTRVATAEYSDDDAPQWPVMKIFEEELERAGAIRPSAVASGEDIASVYGFISKVCPMEYGMQRWLEIMTARKGEEGLRKIVEEHAVTLGNSLARWGF